MEDENVLLAERDSDLLHGLDQEQEREERGEDEDEEHNGDGADDDVDGGDDGDGDGDGDALPGDKGTAAPVHEDEHEEEEGDENLGTSSFPVARMKRVIRSDKDVSLLKGEVVFLISKATELFIADLVRRSWPITRATKRKSIFQRDVNQCIRECPMFQFLEDDLLPDAPRAAPAKPSAKRQKTTAPATTTSGAAATPGMATFLKPAAASAAASASGSKPVAVVDVDGDGGSKPVAVVDDDDGGEEDGDSAAGEVSDS